VERPEAGTFFAPAEEGVLGMRGEVEAASEAVTEPPREEATRRRLYDMAAGGMVVVETAQRALTATQASGSAVHVSCLARARAARA
jgi:hypothetical protein